MSGWLLAEDVEKTDGLERREEPDEPNGEREDEQSILVLHVLALDHLGREKEQRAPHCDCAVDPPWLVHICSLLRSE